MSRGGRRSRALRVLSRHLCSSTGGIRYRPLHLPPLPTTPGSPPQLSERPFGLEMDIDLAAPLALHAAAEIRESLHRHGLLLFRRQSLTPQRQIEVTEACWGPVEPHPLQRSSLDSRQASSPPPALAVKDSMGVESDSYES